MNFFKKSLEFFKLFKFCFTPQEEPDVEMAKDSSNMEGANIKTDSESSQVTSSGDSSSNEDSKSVETMENIQNRSEFNAESMAEAADVDFAEDNVSEISDDDKFNE